MVARRPRSQRVEYKLSVLVYRCLHNLAPEYLCDERRRVADISSGQRLRSSSMSALIVPPTWLFTVSDKAFPVAASRVWNCLPLHVTSEPSLQTIAQIPLCSSRLDSARLDTFDVSNKCILAVSSLSNSTARLARHDESDSRNLLCNFYKVMITVIHVLFNVSYSLIYWFHIYSIYII